MPGASLERAEADSLQAATRGAGRTSTLIGRLDPEDASGKARPLGSMKV
jgi:hypothetical protein